MPEYLEERKARWAVEDEAKRKAAEIAAACPPGHRMMPEEERVATLELVTSSLAEAKAMVREAACTSDDRATEKLSPQDPDPHHPLITASGYAAEN